MGATSVVRDRLVGREALVARVAEALASRGGVVLTGPTGVGKSALARRAARDAGGEGASAWVQGTPGMAGVPLGALVAHLVADGDAAPLTDVGTEELAHRLLRSLRGSRPLVVVDDLQWVDDLTVAVVHQLRQVDGLRVLVTIRDGERLSSGALSLGRSAGMARLAVEPLPAPSVGELITTWLGGPADAGLVDSIATRAEGNPLFVTELLAGAEREGSLVSDRGVWRLRGDLTPSFVLDEVVASRLDGLAPACARGAELLAVGEQLALDHAERCLGAPVLDELDRAGLVRTGVEGGREVVSLGHPVHGEVLRARLGGLARRRHCRDLATSLGSPDDLGDVDSLRLARWCLEAGEAISPALAIRAGRSAFGTFDLELAERLARRGWDEAPTAAAGNLLAEVLHTRGDLGGAELVLLEVHRLSHDERDAARTVALEALGQLHGSGDPDAALALVRAGRTPMVDPEARLALWVAEVYVLLMSESFAGIDEVVAALEAESPAHTTIASRQLVAGAHIIRGRLPEAVALLVTPVLVADDLFVRSQDLELMAGGVRALALLRGGHLDEAEEVAAASHRRCIAEGDPRSRAMAAVALAIAGLLRGTSAEARTWATDAVVALEDAFAPNLACLAHAVLLSAVAEEGDREAAAAPTAALLALEATTERLYAAWSVRARATATALLDGDEPAAAARLMAGAHHYLAGGGVEYAADLAYEAVRHGAEPEAALAVLDAAGVVGPLPEARRDHVRALAAGDRAGLEAAGDVLLALGCRPPAGQALAAAADLARAAGDVRAAQALDHRCGSLGSPSGPTDDAAGPVGPSAGPWLQLSDRERDVATLVARGLTSKAVAAELHLSPRTVDNNLQRIYAKLGLGGRQELAALVASLGLPAAETGSRPPARPPGG